MKYGKTLNEAIIQAKNGSTEGFETLYILTYQDIYQNILKNGYSDKQAEELIETLYVSVYGKIMEAPEDESQIEEWLREILYGLGGEEQDYEENSPQAIGWKETETSSFFQKADNLEESNSQGLKILNSLPEEKAATLLLKIEEHLGILPKEEPEEEYEWELKETEGGKKSFFRIIISIILAVFVVFTVWACLWHMSGRSISGWNKNRNHKEEMRISQKATESEATETEPESTTEEEKEETIEVHLADQVFVLGTDGKLISSKREEEEYHPAEQKYEGFQYYLHNNGEMKDTLFRVYENNRAEYEIIDKNVKDYVLVDGMIYYVRDGMIEQRDVRVNFGKKKFTYHLTIKENGFYMMNEIEEFPKEDVQTLEQDGIVYQLDHGYVHSVKEADCWYKNIRYVLEDRDGDGRDELCWTSQSGEGILVKEGFWIDSFCLAGDWIYYSAFEQTDPEDRYYSRIYRIKPDGSNQELVTDTFQGNITHMYYNVEKGKIYGEYMPDVSHQYYGKLAVISLSGTITFLDDSAERTGYQTSGNDILKFVGTEGNQVYCYWYDCQWTRGETPLVMWIKPLILNDAVEN